MDYKNVKLNGRYLRVYRNGDIYRLSLKTGLQDKEPIKYRRKNEPLLIIACTFLGLELGYHKGLVIERKNGNVEDNSADNLRIVSQATHTLNKKIICSR